MASDGVIDVLLEFAQVDRLGRNASVTRGFVPGRDKMSRIRTPFDDNDNLIHTSNSITVISPIKQYQTRSQFFAVTFGHANRDVLLHSSAGRIYNRVYLTSMDDTPAYARSATRRIESLRVCRE